MSIAPIVHSVEVKAAPARAFELFTMQMSRWWPQGGTIGGKPHAAIIIEPQPGGRWFERDEDGKETQWGKVLAWEPPGRVLLGWQIDCKWGFDPGLLTEVEINFAPLAAGGTRVTLVHRDLERFGADAAGHVQKLNGGWPTRLRNFADFTGT